MSTEFPVLLANQKQFPAGPEQTLLDAARQAGLALEHSCRTGRCGTCKARVIEGEVRPLLADSALSEDEHRLGYVLTCASAAASPLRLDIEDLGALADIQLKTLPARIDSLERVAPDVLRVMLRVPPNQALRFLPGQYINIIQSPQLQRSYSLANAPLPDGRLELHVRRVDGGAMSAYWFEQAKANDLLRLEGPRGSFYLREVSGQRLVLLATGTGLAPIKALLEGLKTRGAEAQPRSVELLWGGRRPEDLYWPVQDLLPGLRYTPVLSRADAGWAGARGHVQDVLLAQDFKPVDTQVYACGSPAMIASARQALLARGLESKNFHSDAFVSS